MMQTDLRVQVGESLQNLMCVMASQLLRERTSLLQHEPQAAARHKLLKDTQLVAVYLSTIISHNVRVPQLS
jgi:hypothetical protein